MKKQTLVRDATVMLLALFAAYAMVMLTQAVMGRIEGVAMLIFMLAVFVTSMYTEGYAWGVAASLISVLAVNFAFLSPYFAFTGKCRSARRGHDKTDLEGVHGGQSCGVRGDGQWLRHPPENG